MRPDYIHLEKFEEGNPVNKERDKFNRRNEALLHHRDEVSVLFIGDSITAYWDLDSYFKSNAGRIINRGVSDDRTTFVRRRFEADALQLKPQMIILSIGVNNTKSLDNICTEVEAERVTEEIITDIEAMVTAAESHHIPIAVTSVTSTHRPHLASFELRAKTIKHINNQLQQLAADYSIIYIDYYTPMTVTMDGIDHLNPSLTDDGLHPHVEGYDVMARVLDEAISPQLIERRHPS